MNKKIIPVILMFIFNFNLMFAAVNTRLILVTNSHNSPVAGIGTLIIDVEAQSATLLPLQVDISDFEDAFQIDPDLQTQVLSVSFSNQRFNILNYVIDEDYDPVSGIVSYIYNFGSGTRGTIGNLLSWTSIVRITIQYTMTPANSTISWYNGVPDFLVTDDSNEDITGEELDIPAGLIEFPLPVELNSFTAKSNRSSIELKWQTKTEVNNYGFEIERIPLISEPFEPGQQNSNFEKIGFVEGNGNSNSIINYSFIDKNPTGSSKFAYRLKQIDNDGGFSYTNVIEVELIPDKFELFQNYPNPFNPVTNIKFSLPQNSKVIINVFNIVGEYITTLLDKEIEAGFHSILFEASYLPSGTYFYRIQTEGFSKTNKMLLLK